MGSKNDSCFITVPGFCPDCGSILPLLDEKKATVTCYACKRNWGSKTFGNLEMTHTIHFNSKDAYASTKEANDSDDDADGPIVERSCPQCKNDKMSYATLQLRSADEGQTIFYTCTKCKYKETENS
ncbi:DNA-directed RNA polymerase I subunit RPA12 [Cataglyphis hispanica]|uniref:DNA-directed RNA polymerase I subunit RPA12 n=1 Tax=Cataglyphis hispanica TaxID=1086592 RepID=UPI00217F83E1|nr:DNA-directed RNA polymerase I subunit RPA12 [Cataglyphis hispanica]XP_050453875.1 DNA-directed RNA polymerase I subunit RPA12 [Cataglyphis hispanica]